MKSTFLLLLTILLVIEVAAQPGSFSSSKEENGTVFLIRSSGLTNIPESFTVFIDDILACRMVNESYTAHLIAPGEHRVSVQFRGKKPNEKAKRLVIDIEAGKKYYLQIITEMGAFTGKVYCREISEEAALQVFKKLRFAESCR